MGEAIRQSPGVVESWLTATRLGRALLCLLAVAPFQSLYVRHFNPPSGVPTGFIMNDMPVYNANARAVFERGNGLLFANPCDVHPDAPMIYFHWFACLLGIGIVKLGFDPGIQFAVVGLISGLLVSWLTLRVVDTILPQPCYKALLFLIAMWGGGIICLEQMYANLLAVNPLDYMLLANDPCWGWWFLNWGRNLVYPTEATYHVLMAACWLAALRGVWYWSVAAAAALAATHPFSGFQALLILLTYSGLHWLVRPSWRSLARWAVVLVPLAAFFAYNFVFLERFEDHRAVREQMSLDWHIDAMTQILAYSTVGFLAACRVILELSHKRRLSSQAGFLLTCFIVSFLLSKHEWFVQPRQPLHFTRGYVWLPLCLLGLPVIQECLVRLRAKINGVAFAAVTALGLAILVSDNAGFIFNYVRDPIVGYVLKPDQWDALDWMQRHHLRGGYVASDGDMTYLAGAYTSLRPYYSHALHTPHYADRFEEGKEVLFSDDPPADVVAQLDYVLVVRNMAAKKLAEFAKIDSRRWKVIYENPTYTLLGHEP